MGDLFVYSLPVVVGPRRIHTQGTPGNALGYSWRASVGMQSCKNTRDRHRDRRSDECASSLTSYSRASYWYVSKHKLGADKTETIRVIESDPNNRLRDIGPEREIEVRTTPAEGVCWTDGRSALTPGLGLDAIRLSCENGKGELTPYHRCFLWDSCSAVVQYVSVDEGTLLRRVSIWNAILRYRQLYRCRLGPEDEDQGCVSNRRARPQRLVAKRWYRARQLRLPARGQCL